jgi:hypothetical protein
MNTDSLIERTMVMRPRKKLYVVKFTEWTQADTLRELLGAHRVDIRLAMSRDAEPQLQFHARFGWDDSALAASGAYDVSLRQGDYLITDDPPEPDTWTDEISSRRWRVATAQDVEDAYERYRPER